MNKHTVIGKHALVLHARGEKEIAAQFFVYDFIREVRVDLENLEVKVLMNYDAAYFRVFQINKPEDASKIEEAEKEILGFYNGLVNASMKLTQEEKTHLQKQQKEAMQKMKAAQEKTK